MWIPNERWQQQGSFWSQVDIPTAGPCDPPLVCFSVNEQWLPLMLGSLSQLIQPTTWATNDPAALDDVLAAATYLMAVVGGAMPCNTTPPVLPGHTTAETACNVAGYLANAVIRESIQKAIDAINENLTVLGWGQLIIGLIPGAGLIINTLIKALNDLYQAMVSGTLSHYQDAINDPTLFGRIACAIYGCISSDGGVTQGNFSCVVTAVGAVSYTHSDVITAIVDYLNNLGADGLAAMQSSGALADYDCSGCPSGHVTGYPGLHIRQDAGKATLTILAGQATETVDILFSLPFTAPPVVTISSDNPVLIASAGTVTDSDFIAEITAAEPVLVDTVATVSWVAVPEGSS